MKTQLTVNVRIGCHKLGCQNDCSQCKPQEVKWLTPEEVKREEVVANHGTN